MADLLQKLFGPKHKHSSSDGGKMADGEGYTKQQSEFCEFFCVVVAMGVAVTFFVVFVLVLFVWGPPLLLWVFFVLRV